MRNRKSELMKGKGWNGNAMAKNVFEKNTIHVEVVGNEEFCLKNRETKT